MTDKNRKYRLKPVLVGNNSILDRAKSEPSAVIQIEDTNGGFLTARLDTAQRNSITDPALGLMIWNTDTSQIEVFGVGSTWASVGGGGGGSVNTVFGRSGNVIAVAGDYAGSEISVTPVGNLSATDVQAALVELQTDLDALPAAPVVSIYGRTGAVVATAGDYTAGEVTNVPSGNLVATTVQAALDELQTELDTITPTTFGAATTAADNATGAGGTATTAARSDHKHAAQGISADAGNNLTVGTDGLHYAIIADEVIDGIGVLTGAAPLGAQWGVDTSTGQAFYVSGGVWTAVPAAAVDLNLTVVSEAGNNAGAVPITPPAAPDIGDVHLEIYDDFLVWWSWGGASWINSAQVGTNPSLATVAPTAPDGGIGTVGTSTSVAREDHKHASSGISTDANNILSVGTDGLHHLPLDASAWTGGNLATIDTTLQAVADSYNTFVAGKARIHAADTTVAPAVAGSPTAAEIATFASGIPYVDGVVYYTGDDIPASAPTYVYIVDTAGAVTELVSPVTGAFEFIDYTAGTLPTPTNDFDLLTYTRRAVLSASSGAGGTFNEVYNFNKIGIVDSISINNITSNTTVAPNRTSYEVFAINCSSNVGYVATISPPSTTSGINNRDSIFFSFAVQNGTDATLTVTFDATYVHADGTPVGTATITELNASRYMKFVYDRRSFIAGGGNWVLTESIVPQFPMNAASASSAYVGTFNATTDWGTAVGGYYLQKITAITHGIANPYNVQAWELVGPDYELVTADRTRIYANGDVEIQAVEVPDSRFAGRIVIS